MKVIRFNKDFSKLDNDEFCTLRLEGKVSKYSKNKEYQVVTPTKEFIAQCTYRTSNYLKNISDEFLIRDTDEPTRQRAIAHLSKYYPNLNDDTVLTVIYFKKVTI